MVQRSNSFNPNLNPAFLKLVEQVAGSYSPYEVRLTSGYRPGDPRYHGKGSALDFALIDRNTGQALPSYQDPRYAAPYQAFANAVYRQAQASDPALAEKMRWGGYFSGGKGKYGAADWMHLDIGGGPGGTPMAGGSWEGGFTPEMRAQWGLDDAGGAGAAATANANLTPQQQWASGLWQYAQAASAKTGVDPRVIMAQAALETGWGKSAPNNNYFGIKGKGATNKTLEYINGKMTPVQADFRAYQSPEEAFADYANVLMGGRYADVRGAKGLEAQIAALGKSGYATDPDYAAKLLKIAQGIPEGGYVGGSTAAPAATTDSPYKLPAKEEKTTHDKIADMLDAMGKVDFTGGSKWQPMPVPAQPGAAIAQAQTPAPKDPQVVELQRQKLAAMMQRLNQGSLV